MHMRRNTFSTSLLLLPSGAIYAALLLAPVVLLLRTSLLPEGPGAPLEGALSLSSYAALADHYYVTIFARTLRIAALTTLFCLVLGYPLALSVSRSRGTWRGLQLLLLVSPLFVSVVVRAYGWVLLLGNRGLVNAALLSLGVIDAPIRLLHSETAVVLALVEALLPFMAISILAVLDRLAPELEEAARGLGASRLETFRHVTLPLSLPGALSGALLVFMVSMGSYANSGAHRRRPDPRRRHRDLHASDGRLQLAARRVAVLGALRVGARITTKSFS